MSGLVFWKSARHPSLCKVQTSDNALFLTFDDGPNPQATPHVLDLLKKHQVTGTFFIIAEKARANRDLIKRIKDEGHTIGNHSLDHKYRTFFSGREVMTKWIQQSEETLRSLEIEAVGFRPPAGVRTPHLFETLEELKIPLIMWQHRFYDTNLKWTVKRALKSLERTSAGDIVLLHDSQKMSRLPGFLETLETYIHMAKQRGFTVRALTADDCQLKQK